MAWSLIFIIASVSVASSSHSQNISSSSNCKILTNGAMKYPVGNHQLPYTSSTIPTVFQIGGTANVQYSDIIISKWYPIFIPPREWTPWCETFNTGEIKIETPIKATAIINDLVYFAGVASPGPNQYAHKYNLIPIFNMSSYCPKSWSYLNTTIPTEIRFGCVDTNGTHIFMIGGVMQDINNYGTYYQKMQIINLNTMEWSIKDLPNDTIAINIIGGWAYQYCTMVDVYLFIFGGKNGIGYSMNDILKYDTMIEKWTHIGYKSVKSSEGHAAYHSKYDIIYLIGGNDENGNKLKTVDIFSVKSQEILSTMDLVFGVSGAPAVVILDQLWIFGGMVENNVTDLIQIVNLTVIANQKTISPTILPIIPPTISPIISQSNYPTIATTVQIERNATKHMDNRLTFTTFIIVGCMICFIFGFVVILAYLHGTRNKYKVNIMSLFILLGNKLTKCLFL